MSIKTLKLLINFSLLKQTLNGSFSSVFCYSEKDQPLQYKKLVKKGEATITFTQAKNMECGRVFLSMRWGYFPSEEKLNKLSQEIIIKI